MIGAFSLAQKMATQALLSDELFDNEKLETYRKEW